LVAVLGLLSLIASLVFFIIALISVFRKNGKAKKQFMIMGILFVVFIIAMVIAPTDSSEDSNSVANSTTETVVSNNSSSNKEAEKNEKEEQKLVEKQAKEEEKAKKKAEEEAEKKEKEALKLAEKQAKEEEEAKKKAEEEAKKKADEEAKLKAKQEKLLNPDWNTTEVDAFENGNLFLALDMIEAMGTVPLGEEADSEAVIKTPWNYYGKPIEFIGFVAVVEDFPPGSDVAQNGFLSDIVIETYEGTIVEFFSMVPSGEIRVGDEVAITGYPVGRSEVENRMGGSFTHLIVVTNNVDQ